MFELNYEIKDIDIKTFYGVQNHAKLINTDSPADRSRLLYFCGWKSTGIGYFRTKTG